MCVVIHSLGIGVIACVQYSVCVHDEMYLKALSTFWAVMFSRIIVSESTHLILCAVMFRAAMFSRISVSEGTHLILCAVMFRAAT